MLFNKAFNPHSVEAQDVLSGDILKIRAQFESVKMFFICRKDGRQAQEVEMAATEHVIQREGTHH